MRPETLLVVDDSPLIVRILSMILRKAGYNVETAGDGEEAIQKAIEVQPAIIFLDAMMPKKDGYEVARELRRNPHLKHQPYIIMLTALDQPQDRERAKAEGVDEVMTKPFTPAQVTERIQTILRERRAA